MAGGEVKEVFADSSDSNSPVSPTPERRERSPSKKSAIRPPSTKSVDAAHRWAKNIGLFILDQWFLVVLGILIIISSQVQVSESQQSVKTTAVTYLCVAIIFLITGCTLPTQVLVENYSRWKIHLFVQIQCFLLASAVVFGIVSAAATSKRFMDPWLLIGLIFTGSVPTAISSNVVMTRKADGNTALTVVESTVGNFLGPFITPLLVQMYTGTGAWWTDVLPTDRGSYGEIYRRVFKQLGLSIFLPMFVGQVIQYLFPNSTEKFFIDWKLNKLGSFSLLIIIWQTFDQAFASGAFASVKGSNLVFVVFINIAHFTVWLVISLAASVGWLSRKDTVAVAYCVPAKTPAMGVPLSNVLFVGLSRLETSKIQVPMVIFQGIQIFLSSLLIPVFKGWVAREGCRHDEKGTEEQSTCSEDSEVTKSAVLR